MSSTGSLFANIIFLVIFIQNLLAKTCFFFQLAINIEYNSLNQIVYLH